MYYKANTEPESSAWYDTTFRIKQQSAQSKSMWRLPFSHKGLHLGLYAPDSNCCKILTFSVSKSTFQCRPFLNISSEIHVSFFIIDEESEHFTLAIVHEMREWKKIECFLLFQVHTFLNISCMLSKYNTLTIVTLIGDNSSIKRASDVPTYIGTVSTCFQILKNGWLWCFVGL